MKNQANNKKSYHGKKNVTRDNRSVQVQKIEYSSLFNSHLPITFAVKWVNHNKTAY